VVGPENHPVWRILAELAAIDAATGSSCAPVTERLAERLVRRMCG